MEKYLFLALAFSISLISGLYLIPSIILVAKKKRLFDLPNERKVHTKIVPRLGGVSFFPCMTISVGVVMGLRYYFGSPLPMATEGVFLVEYLMLLSSLFMLYLIGLADDLIGMGYKFKFIMQILAAGLILFTGIQPHSFGGILGIHEIPSLISCIFAIGTIVLMVNAYNLIDGVDGLCSGLSFLALISLSSLFVVCGMYVYTIVSLAMAGIVLAFFMFNVSRRLKIFMGDTGSLTLGFLISFLCFKLIDLHSEREIVSDVINNPIALSFGMVFIPVFDTLRVFAVRIKNGKSPFHADKIHIHHKLLELGFTHRNNTMTIITAQIGFFALNLVTSQWLDWNINFILLSDFIIATALMVLIEIKIKSKKSRN